jgi:hypothetical protein
MRFRVDRCASQTTKVTCAPSSGTTRLHSAPACVRVKQPVWGSKTSPATRAVQAHPNNLTAAGRQSRDPNISLNPQKVIPRAATCCQLQVAAARHKTPQSAPCKCPAPARQQNKSCCGLGVTHAHTPEPRACSNTAVPARPAGAMRMCKCAGLCRRYTSCFVGVLTQAATVPPHCILTQHHTWVAL